MKKSRTSTYLWIFSIIFTILTAYYQRRTGPTYPEISRITIDNQTFKNKLITTFGGDGDAEIRLNVPNDNFSAFINYKRYKSYDDWIQADLIIEGDKLIASIPHQPPAGKVIYQIFLTNEEEKIPLTEDPVIIRFKGAVPAYFLIPHILIIFLAMVFSNRTAAEVLVKGKKTFQYTGLTVIFLLIGGMILGPVIQKYAFGAFWTGWPAGQDLTDNKTAVSFILWVVAYFQLRKNRTKGIWALIAAIVLLAIYLIPHSVLGSEIDYTSQ